MIARGTQITARYAGGALIGVGLGIKVPELGIDWTPTDTWMRLALILIGAALLVIDLVVHADATGGVMAPPGTTNPKKESTTMKLPCILIAMLCAFVMLPACAPISKASLKPGDVQTTNSGESTYMITKDGWSGKHALPGAYAGSVSDSEGNGFDLYGSTPIGGTFVGSRSVSMFDTKNLTGTGLDIQYNDETGVIKQFSLATFEANASDPISAATEQVKAIVDFLKTLPEAERDKQIKLIEETFTFLGEAVSPEMLALIKSLLGGV